MGSSLQKPVTSHVITRNSNNYLNAATSYLNGYRNSQEDAHSFLSDDKYTLIGIFDGHSNDLCSNFVSHHLFPLILEKLQKNIYPFKSDERTNMIESVCIDIDKQFVSNHDDGGTTATFAIIEYSDDTYHITICNIGDSRTHLICDNQLVFASSDHTPRVPLEEQRIHGSGSFVHCGRINGNLAVSRAFGDKNYKSTDMVKHDLEKSKKYAVTCIPDITYHEAKQNDMIILCCDGVFEGNFTSDNVANLALAQISNEDLAIVSSKIIDMAIEMGSKDNISCTVVILNNENNLVEQFGDCDFVPRITNIVNNGSVESANTKMAQKFFEHKNKSCVSTKNLFNTILISRYIQLKVHTSLFIEFASKSIHRNISFNEKFDINEETLYFENKINDIIANFEDEQIELVAQILANTDNFEMCKFFVDLFIKTELIYNDEKSNHHILKMYHQNMIEDVKSRSDS